MQLKSMGVKISEFEIDSRLFDVATDRYMNVYEYFRKRDEDRGVVLRESTLVAKTLVALHTPGVIKWKDETTC